jgi:Tol biopolymer transport system component
MEVWIVRRGQAAAQRLVGEPGAECFGPIWSPDGTRVAYGLTSETGRKGIFVRGADGGGPPAFLGGNPAKAWIAHPTSWSPDGSAILVNMGELMNLDVGAVAAAPPGGTPSEPRSLISGPAFDQGAVFSPDGKWIALSSNESGRDEIYLRPYSGGAAPGPPTQVSTTGGRLPRWNRDGTGIVYESLDGRILSASVRTRPNLSVLPPTPIWDLNALGIAPRAWDLLPDGSLLGARKAKEEDEFKRIDVVLNFNRELDAKMSTRLP